VASLPATRRGPAAESAALLVGTAVNGLAAYAYISAGSRHYSVEDLAPVAVLWTFWLVAAAALTFPLQHWAIRRIRLDGHDGGVASALPRLGAAVLALSTLLAVIAFLWGERLFNGDSVVWPVLVFVVTVSSAVLGLQRGVLAGRGRYYSTAAAIAAENLVRLAGGVAVVMLAGSVEAFAATLALGLLVVGLWPGAWRFAHREATETALAGFLGGLAGGILIAQVVLNVGPALLKAIGGEDADVSGLWLTLSLFRAPYLLALGLATRLTGPLTSLVMQGRRRDLARMLAATVALTAVGAGAGALFGYAAGPGTVDLIFGGGVSPGRGVVAAISAGSVIAIGALLLILVLLAMGRTVPVLLSWTAGLVAGAVVLIPASADLTAVVTAFVVAEVVAFAASVGAAVLALPRDRT
jgi:O-antigen/teichoic acid export membrane protein